MYEQWKNTIQEAHAKNPTVDYVSSIIADKFLRNSKFAQSPEMIKMFGSFYISGLKRVGMI